MPGGRGAVARAWGSPRPRSSWSPGPVGPHRDAV